MWVYHAEADTGADLAIGFFYNEFETYTCYQRLMQGSALYLSIHKQSPTCSTLEKKSMLANRLNLRSSSFAH